MEMNARVKRRLRWAVVGVAAILLGYAAFSLLVIQFPRVDSPRRADAVVVLGAPDPFNLAAAQKLIDQGYSDELVISVPYEVPYQCTEPQPAARVHVLCFVPDPTTTEGEAREIGRLAAANGWNDIIVVTWTTHIARSRYLIEQCYPRALQMVDYRDTSTFWDRLYENVYQTGAFVKAAFGSAC